MSDFYLFQARSVGKGIKQLDVVCITGDACGSSEFWNCNYIAAD